jgi:hypothetical protein
MQGATADDDGVHLGVDGQPLDGDGPIEAGEPFSEWTWVGEYASGSRVTLTVEEPGLYSVNLWMEDDGVMVDRLLLTTDEAYVPEAEGPAESAENAGTAAESELPGRRLSIRGIYPNPVTDGTRVAYTTSATTHVRLEVFDVIGRRVALLLDNVLPAGDHEHIIKAPKFAAGSYFVRLSADGESVTRQVAVVR